MSEPILAANKPNPLLEAASEHIAVASAIDILEFFRDITTETHGMNPLSYIKLENFRSHRSSKKINLSKINIFLGPNNAGKSALMSAIQLALQSLEPRIRRDPLATEHQADFASFESLVHQRGEKRKPSSSFQITIGWRLGESASLEGAYQFREQPGDGRAYVHKVDYRIQSKDKTHSFSIHEHILPNRPADAVHYHITNEGNNERDMLAFASGIPIPDFATPKHPEARAAFRILKKKLSYSSGRQHDKTVIVMPHRPIPKSAYVLDDPAMSAADREIISHLVRAWTDTTNTDRQLRARIQDNLALIGIADKIEVKRPKIRGIQLVEVRVATHGQSEMLTIADVGYGVSQVLPLVSQDASLAGGFLMAYQPEVHLHPFAQSRLADLFVKSAKRGNTIFVETHSPDLILRLQTLIAKKKVAAKDVAVFCVEHDGQESTVEPLSFDDRGTPSPRWPKGFLDTSLVLASELAQSRIS